MRQNNRKVGSSYEETAASYLIRQGFVIKERNFRSKRGEIDIIAQEGGYLVFIEVKYRKNKKNGEPAEAVTYYKQQRIRAAARYYLYSHGFGEDIPCRFDVVAILGDEISLIRDAF